MAPFSQKLHKLSSFTLRRQPTSRPPSTAESRYPQTASRKPSTVSLAGSARVTKKKSFAQSIRSVFTGHSDTTSVETEPEHPLTHASSVETQDTRTTTASSVPDSSESAEVPRSEPAAVRETQSPGRESLYPESQGKFADEQVRSQPQLFVGGAFGSAAGGEAPGEASHEEARESAAFEEQGVYGLDGAEAEVEGRKGGGQAQKGALSVRDRVMALEARSAALASQPAPAALRPAIQQAEVPIVYPLHVKRFWRRTSSGTPLRPETPIYRSKPDDEPFIHAPRPTRSIPSIKTPSPATPTTAILDTSKDKHGASWHPFGPGTQLSRNGGQRTSPASFPRGTKDDCARHGRRHIHSNHAAVAGTKDLARSRSGAYFPIGLTVRRQMEATSPWVVAGRSLTKTDAANATSRSTDACPDCMAELNIKRKELQRESTAAVKRPTDSDVQTKSSMQFERMTSVNTSKSVYESRSGEQSVVVTRDLGDDLDAVIVEHKGSLRRVVTNARHGTPTTQTMQRLSRELAQVSSAIASAAVDHRPTTAPASQQPTESAVVLKITRQSRDVRTSSVPELIDMIDQAASEIHRNSAAPAPPAPNVEEPSHHNIFHYLNPFHRKTPSTTLALTPAHSPKHAATPLPVALPTQQLTHLANDAVSVLPTRHRIMSNPNPYHHAPAIPRDIDSAQWADAKVREQQQVTRNAMRMDKDKVVQEAAAIERDLRRKRSLAGTPRKSMRL